MTDLPDGPITRSRLADLGIRFASAIILGPVALALTWLGGHPFAVVCALAGMAMCWEWNGITRRNRADLPTLLGIVAIAAAVLVFVGYGLVPALGTMLAGAAIAQLASPERTMPAGAAAATIYGALPALALIIIRSDTDIGLVCVFWLFAIVWAGDIAAYFTGRTIGGPKLWRRVSPKKTWSGAIGGLIGAVAVSSLVLWQSSVETLVPIVLPIVLSIVAQGGDLAESALKRAYGAKDSSRLVTAAVLGAVIGIVRAGVDQTASGLVLW